MPLLGRSTTRMGFPQCLGPSTMRTNITMNLPLATQTMSLTRQHIFLRSPGRCFSYGRPWLSSASIAREKKKAIDRDFFVSVLEASATRRDVKGYLQKYYVQPRTAGSSDQHAIRPSVSTTNNVAIVKLRDPQNVTDEVLLGVAKTLSQLRTLGLTSVVVLDCGSSYARSACQSEACRLSIQIDKFGEPGSRVLEGIIHHEPGNQLLCIDSSLQKTIQRSAISIVIPTSLDLEQSRLEPVDPNEVILALTKHLHGISISAPEIDMDQGSKTTFSVERMIILDPLGGVPNLRRPDTSHRFINLAQELEAIRGSLQNGLDTTSVADSNQNHHIQNLDLANSALQLLPPTSSAVVTSLQAAAHITQHDYDNDDNNKNNNNNNHNNIMEGSVKTRMKQNPLIHNLLIDKPVYSSSLPFERIYANNSNNKNNNNEATGVNKSKKSRPALATLIKRGMPVKIFPDPQIHPWQPPHGSQSPRFRLDDSSLDLQRLQYLIEDSFNRKLDLEHYMARLKDNLAGVIVAGDYEGGAILTWERPSDMSDQEAYREGRFIPYLDKFAVLKSRQGTGGVADVVFNAMVQECFPEGVCWRSRQNNPVNKWYFERSLGTMRLADTHWTMFWTTPNASTDQKTLPDYESICREIEPSWADQKHIPD